MTLRGSLKTPGPPFKLNPPPFAVGVPKTREVVGILAPKPGLRLTISNSHDQTQICKWCNSFMLKACVILQIVFICNVVCYYLTRPSSITRTAQDRAWSSVFAQALVRMRRPSMSACCCGSGGRRAAVPRLPPSCVAASVGNASDSASHPGSQCRG